MLNRGVSYSWIYTAHISPYPYESCALQCFKQDMKPPTLKLFSTASGKPRGRAYGMKLVLTNTLYP